MQIITNKIEFFMQNLHMSKKSSTFVGFLCTKTEKEAIMKKLLSTLFILLVPFATMIANEYETLNGIRYSVDITAKTASVVYSADYTGVIDIPNVIYPECAGAMQCRVIGVEDGAFKNCTGLTKVSVPYNVKTVGKEAFYGCTSLTQATVAGAEQIGASAFRNTAITFIYLPHVTRIENYTFYNCTQLAQVSLPNSLTDIGDYAFTNCTSLTSINIPNSVKNVWNEAFMGCTNLATVTLPEKMDYLGGNTFRDCPNLKSIKLPEGINTIQQATFMSSGLTSIIIPDSVVTIRERSFYFCQSLDTISLPAGITTIREYAFEYTPAKVVYNYATNPLPIQSTTFNEYMFASTLYVLKGRKSLYEAAAVWNRFHIVDSLADYLVNTIPVAQVYYDSIANGYPAVAADLLLHIQTADEAVYNTLLDASGRDAAADSLLLALQAAQDSVLQIDITNFENYKQTIIDSLVNMQEEEDAPDIKENINEQRNIIHDLVYDNSITYSQNIAKVDWLFTNYAELILLWREDELLRVQWAYCDSCNSLTSQYRESDTCKMMIQEARDSLENMVYDHALLYVENVARVADFYAQLKSDLDEQIRKEEEARYQALLAEFEAYKQQKAANCAYWPDWNGVAHVSDSCQKIIEDAQAAILACEYDRTYDLEINENIVYSVYYQWYLLFQAQVRKEREEGVEVVIDEIALPRKTIRDGQVVIEHGDKVFTVTGKELK